jgi:hypothetical protein
MAPTGFIPRHGGYKRLLSYQKALVVWQGTVHFVKRWVPRGSRTCDQMEQAARSGKQNIVEGSMASATSKEMDPEQPDPTLGAGLPGRRRPARTDDPGTSGGQKGDLGGRSHGPWAVR